MLFLSHHLSSLSSQYSHNTTHQIPPHATNIAHTESRPLSYHPQQISNAPSSIAPSSQKFSFPHTYLNPGSEYILHLVCNRLPSTLGPQKNTPASAGAWSLRIDLKMASQLGRPKFVGARRPVIVSWSAEASLIMMLVASSNKIFAVRY